MVSRRRYDDTPVGRRGASRAPKRRILIVCEGRETERGYFNDFRNHVRNPRVHVEVGKPTGAPITVVQQAIRLRQEAVDEARRQRDDNLLWNEVWSVFDVDDHLSLPDALVLARDHAIEVAVSNPCFELWALLHFQDQHAHIDRPKLRQALKRHLPGYEKSLDFARMHSDERYQQAVQRATGQHREAERAGAPGRNPTTGVPRLTGSIRRES